MQFIMIGSKSGQYWTLSDYTLLMMFVHYDNVLTKHYHFNEILDLLNFTLHCIELFTGTCQQRFKRYSSVRCAGGWPGWKRRPLYCRSWIDEKINEFVSGIIKVEEKFQNCCWVPAISKRCKERERRGEGLSRKDCYRIYFQLFSDFLRLNGCHSY